MGNSDDQALDARIRLKKVSRRGFKVVAKMQLDSHITSKWVNCPKLNNRIPVKEI
jgi:hypothetical protein